MAIKTALAIALDDIEIARRLQPLDEAKAQEIAASLAVHGQLFQPLGLRHTPNATKKWKLVFGRHRLRALELSGVVDLIEGVHFTRLPIGPDEADLVEVEENLARTHYTPFARAVLLAGYREACDREGLFQGRGGDRKSPDYVAAKKAGLAKLQSGFVALAMETFDLSPDQIERLLRIGTALTKPEGLAERLHFSRIARNQSQLLKLAALPEEQLAQAAQAFDAAKGDFFNLMSILNRPPEGQSALLARLKAGASLGDVVAEQKAEPAPSHDFWKQAVSSYSQLDYKGRITATVEHFKHDEKAVRAALKSVGYQLVKIGDGE